ncbi:MAG TPA: hypothetical protein VFT43_06420 [Candidatus Polarisedimenticolia bacterium]|nr:hypothetical protein [Candidatus Polarisedimenticolia bacterium]
MRLSPVRSASLTLLVLTLSAIGLLASVARAAAGDLPYRIIPGPYVKKETSATESPSSGRFTVRGLTVVVEHLEPEARAAFIRTLAPGGGDPFAPPPGQPESYHAFRVAFENDTAQDVTFQPGNVVLITGKRMQQFPIDLTDLYRNAERGGGDPQQAIDRLARLIFDTSTTIPSGRHLARLLMFGPLPERWKEIQLHFSFLQIGAETHTLSFTFHKQPLEG